MDTPSTDPMASCGTSGGWRSQFGHPRGTLGWLVGQVMAFKNRGRGEWVRGLLDPRLEDRVLEIGCGPGVDIAALSGRVKYVVGLDHSREMVRQARRRNADAVEAGRAAVEQGSASALPFADASFDRVFSVNTVQFWPDPALALGEIRRVLRPLGVVAVAIQPRSPGADAATSRGWASKLSAALTAAGFGEVRSVLDERPRVPVVCVLGTNPGADQERAREQGGSRGRSE